MTTRPRPVAVLGGPPLPRSISEVDASWLTHALTAAADPGTQPCVETFDIERIAVGTGFASLMFRLRLTGRDVPASLIIKLPSRGVSRESIDMLDLYRREVVFYRHVAGGSPLPAPRSFYAEIDSDSTDFALLLEDLGDWTAGSSGAGLPADRVRSCIEVLAAHHAWSVEAAAQWPAELFPRFDALADPRALSNLFDAGWRIYLDNARRPPSVQARRFADAFGSAIEPMLDVLTRHPVLIHGDFRADNLFFRGTEMRIIDHQLPAWASGMADIGYLTSQAMSTDERTGHDEDLARHYWQHLVANGAGDYPWPDAWREYRTAVAYHLLYPLLPIRGWEHIGERGRELCLDLVERSLAAIEDIDAAAAYIT